MAMQTSALKKRLMKIRAELSLLKMKERFYGYLNHQDKSRLRELQSRAIA